MQLAFDDLYNLFGAGWRLCLRMAGNIEDAEDYAQEAWIQVWRQIGSYRFELSFATWLYRLVSNVCLQKLRQRSWVDICNVEDMDEYIPDHRDRIWMHWEEKTGQRRFMHSSISLSVGFAYKLQRG